MTRDPATGTASLVVGPEHTATAVGSGDLPVLGTPWLIAVCEAATVAAAATVVGPGETTVGTKVSVEHIAASVPGATVTASARLVEESERRLTFAVSAMVDSEVVGRGTVVRARVDAERFMARLGSS